MKNLQDAFNNILERDETIAKIYRPNRKAIWVQWFFWPVVIPFCWPFLIIGFPIIYPCYRLYLSKRAYAVTNRRILVRGGIIGIDYKAIGLDSINASTVYVNINDKIARRNTGTLEFGSPSTPIGMRNPQGGRANPFRFVHICNPYEEHKQIQEHIDIVREKASKK
jgi:hypothetical protein